MFRVSQNAAMRCAKKGLCRGIFSSVSVSTSALSTSTRTNNLTKILQQMIKATGPLSLSSYMRQCLTNPEYGYYINRDPFGKQGDFITSPEISQMFGEIVGIWLLTQWMAQKKPSRFRFIELGPGRGTLMDDVLRTSRHFKTFDSALSDIYMVEASVTLRQMQHSKLCGDTNSLDKTESGYKSTTKWGTPIHWVESIKDLPVDDNVPSYIVAHEFYDALPIYQFKRTELGWRELLVDVNNEASNVESPLPGVTITKALSPDSSNALVGTKKDKKPDEFKLIEATSWTPASKVVPETHERYSKLPVGSKVEICPEAWEVTEQLASIVDRSGGAMLVVDYGPAETIPIDSMRGIRKQKLVSPYAYPGETDLSADVDFQAVKIAAESTHNVKAYGPVQQGDWLHLMGIGARATALANTMKSDAEKKRIESQYNRLVEKSGGAMGKVYKVMAIVPRQSPEPVGFSAVEVDKNVDRNADKAVA